MKTLQAVFGSEPFLNLVGLPGVACLIVTILAVVAGILTLRSNRPSWMGCYLSLAVLPFAIGLLTTIFYFADALHILLSVERREVLLDFPGFLESHMLHMAPGLVGCLLSIFLLGMVPVCSVCSLFLNRERTRTAGTGIRQDRSDGKK